MLSSESFTCGTVWTLRAGSRSLWCSLLIVVAFAMSPNAPPNLLVDCVLVGIVGSDGLKAFAVAPVLLALEGILPLLLFLSMWSHKTVISKTYPFTFGGKALMDKKFV